MVRHIVMWSLKDDLGGKTKDEVCSKIKSELEALKEKIDVIVSIEVAKNINPNEQSDLVLNSEFKTFEDVGVYAVHPDHVAVATYVRSVVESRKAIDYEY